MSPDPSSIEADLLRLRAAALDESLLARLDACAATTWTALDPAEIRFEQHLHRISPSSLPPALMASLESTLREVPFPGEENIARFPQPQPAAPRHHRGWWAAAAAVALTGAITALLIPMDHGAGKPAAAAPAPHATRPAPAASELMPAGFNRGLTEARDEGVIWQPNKQPHRVVKVVYLDRMTLKDAAGRTYQVEQPRVEYILVPAKND